MNRREFIKLALIGAVSTALPISAFQIDEILHETRNLTDDEFVTYLRFYYQLWVNNPSRCAIITGIAE